MRRLLFPVAFTLLALNFPEADQLIHRLAVQPASTLTIAGETNVNKFQCAIVRYVGNDTLILKQEHGKKPYFTRGFVKLSAASFDCGVKLMTRDFTKTIKAEEFPYITIDFVSLERVPRYQSTPEHFLGKMKISMTGVTIPFDVQCNIVKDENGLVHLTGHRACKFSDFNLKPPTRMLGTVKVREELGVSFHLVLVRI